MRYNFREQTGKTWGDYISVEAESKEEALQKVGAVKVISIYEKFAWSDLRGNRIYEMTEHGKVNTLCLCAIPRK